MGRRGQTQGAENKMKNTAVYELKYGTFEIECENGFVTRISRVYSPGINNGSVLTDCAAKQLTEYFAGEHTEFDFPYKYAGTDFQQTVWEQLRRIPYGQTRSYKQVAVSIGKPNACRAVASACGKNPIMFVVPCHRVVSSDGSLGGFSAGIELKAELLVLEAKPKAAR